MRIAPISSITASPNKNGLKVALFLVLTKLKTPKAKAISVATGIAHPDGYESPAIIK